MNILFAIIGLVTGALLCFIITSLLYSRKIVKLKDEANVLNNEKIKIETELSASLTWLDEAKSNREKDLEKLKSDHKEDLEKAKMDYDDKMKTLEKTLKLMFENEAKNILSQSSKDLSNLNSEKMKIIIDPLAKDMKAFKDAVDASRENSAKNTTTIEQQIKSMMEHTEKISQDANNLAEALRTKNKIVGNWGEVQLENALNNMGLIKGEDYVLQTIIRDEKGNMVKDIDSGKSMIPDAIIYLPDNKAIVIDSKVSLKSFIDYNAETDSERKKLLLKDFMSSVETHIRELSAKKYGEHMKQSGRDALNYVVMFIPVENAFQLFFREYLTKWHEAFNDGIIVTGEANLFAMLKIVQVVWSQHKQQKNLDNILKTSGELLDRVGRFVQNFNDVGKSIASAQSKFDNAQRALSGRQSIKATSNKLFDMGVEHTKNTEVLFMPDDGTPLLPTTERKSIEDANEQITDNNAYPSDKT